ncbi:MAG: glucose-6-phosphate isomerase [Pseudonocardiales bacterium]|nr:glucose-6-phosphate isomerase [Pseudonocardiales bacterium]
MNDLLLALSYPQDADYVGAIRELIAERVASKLTGHDAGLWGPQAESEAAIRLNWVGLAETSRPLVAQITALRDELSGEGVDHVVLAGMGGSSLAPEVITRTAGVALTTLDTTDPGQIQAAIRDRTDRTVLVVSSKSGGTVETDSHRRIYTQAFLDCGVDPKSRIVVVTDPGSPLAQLAADEGYRAVFLADAQVGGRYSALTAFGLVPAGLAGVDVGRLLDEAAAVASELAADDDNNPALRLGAVLGLAHQAGAEKLVIADTGSGITGFGDWVEQLIAESTGKDGKGLLPVVVESVEAPGFHDAGADAVQVVIGPDPSADPDHVHTAYGIGAQGPLGAQFLLWEYAIAIASRSIGVNPFDQPDVEEAKNQARALLDGGAPTTAEVPALVDRGIEVYADGLDLGSATTAIEAILVAIGAAQPTGYLALQAYLDRGRDASAADLRAELAAKSGVQTTFGWGPRFLHSTGQYHKGGHPNGVFIQLTGAVAVDLPIPDRPYTFGSLQAAQAAGDARALRGAGRPVLRLHLTQRAEGLGELLEAL